MKTVKIILGIMVMLAISGLNEAMGQWTTSGNDIYNSNTGNVGIGNNSPATLLYVAKNMTEPNITVRNLGGLGGATFSMLDDASGAQWKFKATSTGGFKIRDNAFALDVIQIEPNSSANAFYINSSGNIGIGTNTPSDLLHVIGGDVRIGNISGDARKLYFGDGAGVYIGEEATDNRMGLSATTLTLNINGATGTDGQVLTSNGTTCLWEDPPAGSDLSGTGTTDYLARWLSSNTLGTGLIRDNNSTVGINAAPDPVFRLKVEGGGGKTAVYGRYDDNHFGYLGSVNYGAYGQYNTSILGYFGSSNYGAYGQYNSTVKGHLGSLYYGAFGQWSDSRYGYMGSTDYGVYGQYNFSISGCLGSSLYGAFGGYDGNIKGHLGSANYGAYGQYNSNIKGYFGSSSYGAYGQYDSYINGYLGSYNYGAYGQYSSSVKGYLGSLYYGAYGQWATDRFGYLGGQYYGAYGQYSADRYGYIGSSPYAVYGRYNANIYGMIGTADYGITGEHLSNGGAAAYFYHNGQPGSYLLQWAADNYMVNSTSNDGTSYAYGANSSGGLRAFNYNGATYTFGVGGWNYNDETRCAGVLGSDVFGNYWGALGYRSSGNVNYGGYFTTSGTGSGKSSFGGTMEDIGIGAWGGLMGADIHGGVYGIYVEGENFGIYSKGAVYSDQPFIQLQKTDGPDRTALYSSSSTDVTVMASGQGQLINGQCEIKFDQDFKNVISQRSPLIITVTPMGQTNGVYIASSDYTGFSVSENNSGRSSTFFSYIVIAKRAGYENHSLAGEVVASDFEQTMAKGLHDDADTSIDGKGLYYQNGRLMLGQAPGSQNRNIK